MMVCKAKGKCPYAELPHGETLEDVSRSYEATKGEPLLPYELSRFSPDEIFEARQVTKQLIDLLSQNGHFELPEQKVMSWDSDGNVHYEEKTVGDFKLLASGSEINAYLHEKSKLVIKIPHIDTVSQVWGEEASEILHEVRDLVRGNYDSLDLEKLHEAKLFYLPTLYIDHQTKEGPLPITIQRYLDPSMYGSVGFSAAQQKMLSKDLGIWDLSPGNVRKNRMTGQLVLIDCVPAWGE